MNLAYLQKYGNRNTGPIAILSIVSAIYLFLTMRPFPLWVLHPLLFFGPIVLVIYTYTLLLLLNNALVITHSRLVISIIIFIFIMYLTMPIFGHELSVVTAIRFAPILCIIFFPIIILYRLFNYFHKIIVFFSVVSIIVFFLLFLNIRLPHFVIPGFTVVMERAGDSYLVYGLVVSSTNTVNNVGGFTFARALGPFLEPGHFAIYLGFTLLAERYLFNTTNKYIVGAGLLTFSPAFLLIGLLIIIYSLVIERKLKTLLSVILASFLMLTSISNNTIRDEVYNLTIGRNFDDVEAENILDNRTSSYVLSTYNSFKESPDYWVGLGIQELEETGILSDYRGFVFKFGVIGMTLLIAVLQSLFLLFDRRSFLLFFPMVLLVLAHRAWMFEAQYIYIFLLVIGLIARNNKLVIKTQGSK